MPLPSPQKEESRKDFVSRCVSMLSEKGEGEDAKQRAAICHSRWEKSKAAKNLAEHVTKYNKDKKKKKKKDNSYGQKEG